MENMMSIFHADTAFALELIALGFGVFLVVWFRIHTEQAHKMCRFFAYLIIALAILALLCTSYYSIKYWVLGYFGHPRAMMMQGKMKSSQMQQMMKRCKMMKNQMQDSKMPMMKDQMQGHMKDRQHMIQQQNDMQQMPMDKQMQSMPKKKGMQNAADHEAHH
jgi:predicted membrane protein